MEYSKYTARELRAMLSASGDAATKADLEAALKSLQEARSTAGAIIAPKRGSILGVVSYTQLSQGGNLLVGFKSCGEMYRTELTPKQLAQAGGELGIGTYVSVQTEARIKGITQYRDAQGDIRTHGSDIPDSDVPVGTSYVAYGLATIISREAYIALKEA